jgi:hypothetical protein
VKLYQKETVDIGYKYQVRLNQLPMVFCIHEMFSQTDLTTIKDDEFPFPWSKTSSNAMDQLKTCCTPTGETRKRKPDLSPKHENRTSAYLDAERISEYVGRYPNLKTLQNQLDGSYPGKVFFRLPRLDALSGNVVLHCSKFLDNLIASQSPVMFKIGYTHNPLWRWGNRMYGYAAGREKWSNMVIIYISPEPHGPSMLEACLIDKYKSTPNGINTGIYFFGVAYPNQQEPGISHGLFSNKWACIEAAWLQLPSTNVQLVQGTYGCKNEKNGGDTCHLDKTSDWTLHMVYVVYRSFKHPPPVPKIAVSKAIG